VKSEPQSAIRRNQALHIRLFCKKNILSASIKNTFIYRMTKTFSIIVKTIAPAAPLPPTRTQHDGTWYGIPSSVWPDWVSPPGYVPSWIPVKINPVLAEPRTFKKEV